PVAHRIDHVHGVGARLLVDRQVDGVAAVDAHDIGLFFARILHRADVGNPYRNAARRTHHHVGDVGNDAELRIGKDVVPALPNLNPAGGLYKIGVANRVDHVQD